MRIAIRNSVLRLPLRPRPASALPRQWRQRACVSDDAKLHPNPKVVPNTDPSSPRPSGNPERADHAGSPAEGVAPGSSNINAQNTERGPNMDQLPHVSEESAAMSKSMGTKGPQLEQGTPVGEVVKDDKEAAKNLPKVMRDALNKQNGGSRSFSTTARRSAEDLSSSTLEPNDPLFDLSATIREQYEQRRLVKSSNFGKLNRPQDRKDQDYPGQWYEIDREEAVEIAKRELPNPAVGRLDATWAVQEARGLRFAEPTTPRDKQRHMQRRYQGVVEQVTNMIMLHGMKARAQKHMSAILTHLQTSAAPSAAGRRLIPLPAHAPNREDLPRHPVAYLTYALDSVAPLMRIVSLRGLAGGGAALQIPSPLQLRQRRRTAIVWILDAVEKRKGGTSDFPKRFAEEIISIVEGRSSVWGKRDNVHRLGVAGRSNLNAVALKRGRR